MTKTIKSGDLTIIYDQKKFKKATMKYHLFYLITIMITFLLLIMNCWALENGYIYLATIISLIFIISIPFWTRFHNKNIDNVRIAKINYFIKKIKNTSIEILHFNNKYMILNCDWHYMNCIKCETILKDIMQNYHYKILKENKTNIVQIIIDTMNKTITIKDR